MPYAHCLNPFSEGPFSQKTLSNARFQRPNGDACRRRATAAIGARHRRFAAGLGRPNQRDSYPSSADYIAFLMPGFSGPTAPLVAAALLRRAAHGTGALPRAWGAQTSAISARSERPKLLF
jgi:hypothetical protein